MQLNHTHNYFSFIQALFETFHQGMCLHRKKNKNIFYINGAIGVLMPPPFIQNNKRSAEILMTIPSGESSNQNSQFLNDFFHSKPLF